MNDYPIPWVPTMFGYQELESFFDEATRTKIASDADQCCYLCKNYVEMKDAHFIPIINDYRTVRYLDFCSLLAYLFIAFAQLSACTHGMYTHALDPHDAANGLYCERWHLQAVRVLTPCPACLPCFYIFISTDDVARKIVLVPCIPLLKYALHAIQLAKDEASRSQTLDAVRTFWDRTMSTTLTLPQILEDLEQYPTASDERRAAAPFLHCFQLHPYLPRSESQESNTDPTSLSVCSSPTTYISDGEGPDATRYCILERHSKPGSVQSPSRRVQFHDQRVHGPVTLWRLPNHSPGALFGNADASMIPEPPDPALYEAFYDLQFQLTSERGLPRGYVPEGGRKSWADFYK